MLLVLPAVHVEECAGAPGVVLGPDVHVGVHNLVLVLVRLRQVIDAHPDADWDGCTHTHRTVSSALQHGNDQDSGSSTDQWHEQQVEHAVAPNP